MPPTDCTGRKGIQQNTTKVYPGYLRSATISLVGLIQQDVGVFVEDILRLSLSLDEAEELLEESCRLECELPVVFMDIEQAALSTCVCRSFRFLDRRGNSMNVEHTRKRQSAEPSTDDRDWSLDNDSFVVRGLPYFAGDHGTSFHHYGMMFHMCQD